MRVLNDTSVPTSPSSPQPLLPYHNPTVVDIKWVSMIMQWQRNLETIRIATLPIVPKVSFVSLTTQIPTKPSNNRAKIESKPRPILPLPSPRPPPTHSYSTSQR